MRAVRLVAVVGAVPGLAACTPTTVSGIGQRAPAANAATSTATAVPSGSAGSGAAPAVSPALRAAHPGTLPAAGRPTVGGVQLALGRPVTPHGVGSEPVGKTPVMWVTDDVDPHAGDTVVRLQQAFPSTGLWPLVLQASETQPDDGRPWRQGEFDANHVTAPSSINVATSLATWWTGNVQDADPEITATLGTRAPSLVRSTAPLIDDVADQTGGLPGRIGLVPVTRPADAPAHIGWLGATNYFDAGYVSAVLRSWEDRYGAVVVRMGFDYLQVAVGRPQNNAGARQAAAEQLAFCPDQLLQGDYDTAAAYATSLVGARSWYCWWD